MPQLVMHVAFPYFWGISTSTTTLCFGNFVPVIIIANCSDLFLRGANLHVQSVCVCLCVCIQ